MAQINLGHVVGQGVPSGGTAGQILKKNGSTNFDTSWATLDGSMVPVSASDSTTVQQSLAAVKSDMGIVEDGNTATHTIAAEQYVIWKGALYTASAAIPAGTTLSTSNLTAVSGGGLNALNGKITDVQSIDCTFANTIIADNFAAKKIGKLVIVCGGITSKTSDPVVFNNGEQIITGGLPPCSYNPVFMGLTYMSGGTQREQYRLRIVGGTLVPYYDSISVPKNGMALYVNICYFTDN